MKISEKIENFNSIEDLVSEIERDRNIHNNIGNRNRYAVRFILLENFDLLKDLTYKLSQKNISIFDLEILTSDDDWITRDDLKQTIENLHGQVMISPFSEIVRFYKDDNFRAFFHEISLLEKLTDDRIYIPLIGLRNRFENFLSSFYRIEESAPVWSVNCSEHQPVKIYLVPTDIAQKSNLDCLKTVEDWLKFWKTYAPTQKILCSSDTIITFSKYSQHDNIFQFIKIENAYQFITKLLEVPVNVEFIDNENIYWLEFLNKIKQENLLGFSLKVFINKYFNVHELSIKNILNKWTDENSTCFDRWLLKHYYVLFISNNDYLSEIIINCVDYSPLRLFREIALSIFVDTSINRVIQERNYLLGLFDEQYKLPDNDLSELKEEILNIEQTDDIDKAILLCSGRFDFEREMLLGWYKIGKLKPDDLRILYPDLAKYINDVKYDSWANSYIQAYKEAKIKNEYTEEIKNYIAEKNGNENAFYEWYYEFELSKELLAKEEPDKVYWVDGLGIEYLSLISEIINNSNFHIQKFKIARTGIPSSTEYNKFENVEKISQLDDFIHDNLYNYPETICAEIDIVKNIFKNILNQTEKTTIAIVSDHGLTALSRLVDSKKYATKSSHEGRYIQLDSTECIEDSDYIRFKTDGNNYKVALTHASLNTKPIREVHGGCTPEEILVPFIIISNKIQETKNISKKIPKMPKQVTFTETLPEKKIGFEEEELF